MLWKIVDNGVKGHNIDSATNRPIYNNITANNQLDSRFNTYEFEVASATDILFEYA